MMKSLALALLLTGCVAYTPDEIERDTYTRAEIDAMRAEAQCRNTARTMLEAIRCEPVGRRP